MSKIGYTGNCGHWLYVNTGTLNCILDGKIVLPGKNMTIMGIGEKCPECFPDASEEIVVYARKDNTISVAPLEPRLYCKLLQACIA